MAQPIVCGVHTTHTHTPSAFLTPNSFASSSLREYQNIHWPTRTCVHVSMHAIYVVSTCVCYICEVCDMHVWGGTWAHAWMQKPLIHVSYSVTLCFIRLKMCLSQNIELKLAASKPRPPPVSIPPISGVKDVYRYFHWWWKFELRSSCVCIKLPWVIFLGSQPKVLQCQNFY